VSFGRGHVIRAGAHRPLPFALSRHARLRAEALPDAVDLTPHIPCIVDQDGTGTCFACAPKSAIETTLAAGGALIGIVISVLDLATLVHAIERAADGFDGQPLWDWGGDPADVVTAITQWGVRPARYRAGTDEAARHCDASPDTVGPDHEPGPSEKGGVEPDFADLLTDADTLIVGAHEIDDTDPITDLRRTLANGACVTVAWRVLPADELAGPDTILDGRAGPADHDSYIAAYKRQPDGTFRFRLVNSWGASWGDRGMAWVTEAFIRSSSCRYAMSVRRAS
jgi:hypothetical protein